MFDVGDIALVVPYNQAHYYPTGGAFEFEHPIAGAALRHAGEGAGYRHEFTIQTPRVTHRSAVGGAGGGITSTGSSTTARGWAHEMGDRLQNDPYDAVRSAAIENINAHAMAGTLNRMYLNGAYQWIEGQATDGRITAAQARALQAEIQQTYWERVGW
jgi:hypothetical protein